MARRNIRIFLTLTIVLLTGLLSQTVTAADTAGTISGQLSNGTPGGALLPEGQQLTLISYQGTAQLDPLETTCDASGNYSFTGLNTGADYVYIIETTFLGTKYISDYQTFQGQTSINYQMKVYDTTTSTGQISVSMAHTIVSLQNNVLSVVNYIMFNNPDTKAYVGDGTLAYQGENVTVLLPLPADATNLQLDTGLMDNCLGADGGLLYAGPIVPGNWQTSYSYTIDAGSAKDYSLSWSVALPTDIYEFLVAGTTIGVASPDLTPGGPVSLQGTDYQYFSAQTISSGQPIAVTFTFPSNRWLTVALWAGVALAVGGSGLIIFNRRKPRVVYAENDEEALLRRIADLDDRNDKGIISKQQYARQRSEYKAKIIRMRQLADRTHDSGD